jgi:hypothetical protein
MSAKPVKAQKNGFFLRAALLAGTGYFIAMTTAHFFSFKKPLLFIYYDTPFYAYQDKIISFCALVYAMIFHAAAGNPSIVPLAIRSLVVTVVGLSLVTTSSALKDVVPATHDFTPYWIQTGVIGALAATLQFLHSSGL